VLGRWGVENGEGTTTTIETKADKREVERREGGTEGRTDIPA